jgi:HEAT repeat protein
MLGIKRLLIGVILCAATFTFAAELEDNWNDFLHYTAIGRFELAEGYGRAIIEGDSDPVRLLELSQSNPRGYSILLKVYSDNEQLKETAGEILDMIEQGRFIKRTDPSIIREEISRLSTTIRGRIKAEQNLKNSGEYAIPYMLEALADKSRKDEQPYIAAALGKMGRDCIRALACSLQMENVAVKSEVIRALGNIRYPEALAYLKFIVENSDSQSLKDLAVSSIEMIDASAMKIPSTRLFFRLARDYYYHSDAIAPSADYDFANIWFWDEDQKRLRREEVSKDYFFELMSMRINEWALKADPSNSSAISLWLTAFFKAEEPGIDMPEYFGQGHADAMTYATTSGPEYLHEALSRALEDEDGYIALNMVEALAVNAGQASLLYRFGTEQPLVEALSFDDAAVRLSAAIAIASANPTAEFTGSKLIVENLNKAIERTEQDALGQELALEYAFRAINAMNQLAVSNNEVIDLERSNDALTNVLKGDNDDLRFLAAEILAMLENPKSQRAIAQLALSDDYDNPTRITLFESLVKSAKRNGQKLTEEQIDAIYAIVSSKEVDPELRAAAAGAYGAFNLPSQRVKELILDQAKS